MAKYSMDEVGSSCHIHSSLWDADGATSLMWDDDAPDHLSPAFRGWLGGLVATGRELAWMFAPTVNSYKRYQPESWAPTALAWGRDNRTCGFRLVGHGQGVPRRVAHPRRRLPTSTSRSRRRSRPACTASSRASSRRRSLEGNAYEATDVPHVPVDARRRDRRVRAQRRGRRGVRRRRCTPTS